MPKTHYFPKDTVHYTWDKSHEPLLRIQSGDTVIFETRDVSDRQFGPNSTTEDVANLNWDKVYPLSGPVFVEGAEPGDTLAIEILHMNPLGWGWTAVLPGLGLLAEDFPDAYLRTFDLSDGKYVHFREDIKIPIEPFFGTMGVCPKDADGQPIMPPGTFGGNLDTRQLTPGTTLYLPVQVAGALFSCGDAHAAQGDGEVCVTGLECPMYATLRFNLIKNQSIPAPQFETAGALTSKVNHAGFYGTTGVASDLMVAAKDALRAMVKHISNKYEMTPEDAYLLSSLCVDLKISEVVDAGQYVVSAVLPLAVFQR
ncbi:acetamidase/formamidase family protein [Alicyclobacillus dauci]|uniref:Acetamidase/formamidase family protein n=1 Tax=Alicyclobacillus dauci TaxID=1475485 RepID=A0ABY6Z9I9_9BACL|nr:acetamidase/formamidase family protein [Alicyclobacillus dauci]WAH39495.1 acetamidase/formamidase family protein [Alicyclobacillus dauci]WAH39555.1 acetamidase/formamidase family protein [Alicyclobacillus dauci]